jgi:hypothetical protein
MPPSTSWNTVTVTGTYRHLDGSAKSGSVKFTVTSRIVAAGDKVIFPAGASVSVNLDNAGHFSVALPATDDPDISPVAWTYRVEETFADGGNATYALSVPLASAGAGIDLTSVVVPSAAIPDTAPQLRGIPGGVAALDPSGQVIDGAGNPVAGQLLAGYYAVQVDLSGVPYIIV